MEDEYWLMDSQCGNHPKGVALAGDIPVFTFNHVRTHHDRFSALYIMPEHEKDPMAECKWRCLGTGPFTVSDMMAPLPPMNEVMADSTKLEPLWH